MSSYTNPVVLKDLSKHTEKVAILKIDKFIKQTPENNITAVVSDSTHKIFVNFPFKSIVKFENENKRRITDHSVHSLIELKKAKLVLYSPREGKQNFGNFPSGSIDLLVLEIDEFEFFSRDNNWVPSVESSLKLVYEEDWYIELCGTQKNVDKYFEGEVQ